MKYLVVDPPFMMDDSWLFNRVFTHLMNILPNPNLFKAYIKNWWLTESKAFWMFIVTNIPFNFSTSVVCKASAIKRPPLTNEFPINIYGLIIWNSDRKTFFRRFDGALEIIFTSTFSGELGLKFWIFFYLCLFFD